MVKKTGMKSSNYMKQVLPLQDSTSRKKKAKQEAYIEAHYSITKKCDFIIL